MCFNHETKLLVSEHFCRGKRQISNTSNRAHLCFEMQAHEKCSSEVQMHRKLHKNIIQNKIGTLKGTMKKKKYHTK